VVTAVGEVDPSSAPLLHDRLREQIYHPGPDLVADLTDVALLDASGLSVLAGVRDLASVVDIAFRVVARTRAVLVPLRVTGLGAVLDVCPDLDHVPLRSRYPPRRPLVNR
jgi:stage II sporulation protein AA (anti-sigma F factor antagonist)